MKQMPRCSVSVGTSFAESRSVFADTRASVANAPQLLHATSIFGVFVESYETSIESPTSTGTVPLISGTIVGFRYTVIESLKLTRLLRKSLQLTATDAVPIDVGVIAPPAPGFAAATSPSHDGTSSAQLCG